MIAKNENIEKILKFWFGEINENEVPEEKYRKMWWIKDPANDMMIKENFQHDLDKAINGDLDIWKEDARSSLALILLLDQFSRNIYRDTKNAFSQDELAVQTCVTCIENDFDKALHPIERIFYYMPLMHCEDIAIQKKSLESFSDLAREFKSPEDIAKMVSGSYEYALKHYEIIVRFGRYPHRNKILGRKSTNEEIEFLTEPGSSF